MGSFFNSENFLWRWSAKLADFVVLSCFWVLCCIPVVTIVPACIALYDATAHCVLRTDGNTYRRFFQTFKKELKRGIPLTFLWAIAAFILNVGYQVLTQLAEGSTGWTLFSTVYFVTLFIPLGAACWAVALESRFTCSVPTLHRDAFLFTFVHLPQTLAAVVLFVIGLNLCLNVIFLLMVVPGAVVYLQTLFMERVLKKYMPEEEAAEISQ